MDFVLSDQSSKDNKPKKITKFSSVCSQHFLPSDYSQSQHRRFLKKSAFPSVIKTINFPDHEVKTLEEDDEPVEIQVEAQDPLNNDCCGLCRSSSNLTLVEDFHRCLVHKCLPLIMINDNFLKKICINCFSILDTFSMFIDKILQVKNNACHPTFHKGFPVPDHNNQPQRIKIEPVANIEEETKMPSIQVINFTPSHQETTKKCEILEIVDIKPFNFDGTLQQENYDDEDEIQILSPTQLKVELTDPDDLEDGSNELEQIRNYVFISTVFLQDHNYFKTSPMEIADEQVKTEYEEEERIVQPQEATRTCTSCPKVFKSFRKLLFHKLTVHQSIKSKLKKRRKNVFVKNQQKIRKMCSTIIRRKQQKVTKENEKPSANKKKSYICPICHKSYPGAKNLYQHKISHQVSNYACETCHKRFKRAHGLKQHIKSIHEKEKNFECPICNHRYLLKAVSC